MTTTRIAAAVLMTAAALTACSVPAQVAHTVPSPTPSAYVPPCPGEDAEVGPCFWDAKKQGNGKGASFFLDDKGRVFYVRAAAGKVTTSQGRQVAPDANSCIFLTYAEQGFPQAGDPGDGELFCA